MGDRTLLERVILLEGMVHALEIHLDNLRGSVVLVAKKKPGRKPLNKKKIEADVRRKIRAATPKAGFKRARSDKGESSIGSGGDGGRADRAV